MRNVAVNYHQKTNLFKNQIVFILATFSSVQVFFRNITNTFYLNIIKMCWSNGLPPYFVSGEIDTASLL